MEWQSGRCVNNSAMHIQRRDFYGLGLTGRVGPACFRGADVYSLLKRSFQVSL